VSCLGLFPNKVQGDESAALWVRKRRREVNLQWVQRISLGEEGDESDLRREMNRRRREIASSIAGLTKNFTENKFCEKKLERNLEYLKKMKRKHARQMKQ
jgi:hypothetical protein